MPLNEAYGFYRSNLTKEQKRAAEAAIYGQPAPNMPFQPLSQEEVERWRTTIAQHDAQASVKEFDLNNPMTPPYVFQAFPTTVYKGTGNKVVPDQEALDKALGEGWKHEPIPPEKAPDPDLEAAAKEIATAAKDLVVAAEKDKDEPAEHKKPVEKPPVKK